MRPPAFVQAAPDEARAGLPPREDALAWASRLAERDVPELAIAVTRSEAHLGASETATRTELLPLTTFRFQGAAGAEQEFQLIKFIRAVECVSGTFEVRVASRDLPDGQSITFVLQPISPASDEEDATYVSTLFETAVRVEGASPVLVPGLLASPLITAIPAFYRLLVRASQDGVATTAFSATVSVSLTMRPT